MSSLSLLFVLSVACRSPASEDTGTLIVDLVQTEPDVFLTDAALTEHSQVATVVVEAPADSEVEVVYEADGTGALYTERRSLDTGDSFSLTGLRAETTYTVQAVAHHPDGSVTRSEPTTLASGPLPDGVHDVEVEVFDAERIQPGITLLGLSRSPVYGIAVDAAGETVWTWVGDEGYTETTHVRDLSQVPGGGVITLMQCCVNVVAPDGTEVLNFRNETGRVWNLHEMRALDDGTFLTVYEEEREVDGVLLRGNGVLQLSDTGEVLWSWDAFDHLDTDRFPSEQSLKAVGSDGALDWTHMNSAQHWPDRDAVLMGVRSQNQAVLADVTTGEVIWALGEDGDFALLSGEWFYSAHSVLRLADGRIAIYDNGNDRPGDDRFSRGVIYELDEQAGTAEQVWEFRTEYFTGHYGSVELLDNGNLLVGAGGPSNKNSVSTVYEVTPEGDVVWQLRAPVLEDDVIVQFYRAHRVDRIMPAP